jgi:CHAT domain-containing protein
VATNSLDFRAQARQLYDLLLGPAQKELAGKQTICLVPSGPLWELPFQALLSARNRYLWEDHALFDAPSLSVLREIRKREDQRESESRPTMEAGHETTSSAVLLAVANPDLRSGHGGNPNTSDAPYSPLPEQERLARTLGQIYGLQNSEILTGKAAQEATVKTDAGKYRILHFATHGILDNDDPLYSGLLLSSGRKDEDGFLEAREIMSFELHAEVAVLSACDTARGRVHEGEGVMGMSWALFVAGTPTTVVSQWKIDSASTARLMATFHRVLKSEMSLRQLPMTKREALLHPRLSYRLLKLRSPENQLRLNKAQALRQAALALMADPKYSHPFYWAGFVVIGDGF